MDEITFLRTDRLVAKRLIICNISISYPSQLFWSGLEGREGKGMLLIEGIPEDRKTES